MFSALVVQHMWCSLFCDHRWGLIMMLQFLCARLMNWLSRQIRWRQLLQTQVIAKLRVEFLVKIGHNLKRFSLLLLLILSISARVSSTWLRKIIETWPSDQTRPSVNYAKDWLDQRLPSPGLAWFGKINIPMTCSQPTFDLCARHFWPGDDQPTKPALDLCSLLQYTFHLCSRLLQLLLQHGNVLLLLFRFAFLIWL